MNEIRDRVKAHIHDVLLSERLVCTASRGHEVAEQILKIPELAVVDVEAKLPALTYEEYMAIHSAWANSKETVENLLRRITLETCYKVRKEGCVMGVKDGA